MYRNLVLRPERQPFDKPDIVECLDARPDVVDGLMDRFGDRFRLIDDGPMSAESSFVDWQSGRRMPSGVWVYVDDDVVRVYQEWASGLSLVGALAFLKWMLARYDCRVVHDGYEDMTEEIRAKGIDSFYPEEVRGDRAPWRKYLIQIGFYVDNQDSRGGVPIRRLANEIADSPQADEDALVAYL